MRWQEKVATAVLGTGVLIAAIAACRSTDDPLEGTANPNGGTSGSVTPAPTNVGSSGGGLLDATVPATNDCGAAPVAAAGTAFTKQALLGAAADCAAWHSCNFVNAAGALQKSVQAGSGREDAWKKAMDAVSKLEGFRFGPWAGRNIDAYQGRGLRSYVHAWPDTSRCEVEKQVIVRDYAKGWDLVFPSARGLYGLEVLFFYPGADTACFPSSPTGQAWATKPADAKDLYAKAIADNLVAVALEAQNAYKPAAQGGEGFKEKLLAAEGYGSEQEALTVVAWSLFYPEAEVKDDKLASLAGIDTRPPNRETPFAKVDIENIRTNLAAFRSLFQGCGADGAGIGFDDWLTAAGHAQLGADILTALANVEAHAATFPAFDQATPAQFKAFYDAIKPLSDLIKGSLFGSGSPLALRLPASAASDTD